MLSSIRNLLDNWIARAFFIALAVVFVFWGVSNVVTMIGSNHAVATVGGQSIQAQEVDRQYQNALNRYAEQHKGQQPGAGERRMMAGQVLGQMIDRTAMALEVKRLGVAAPADAMRRQVFSMQDFQGSNGKFDRARFNQVLADNNLTPDRFMDRVQTSMNSSQVVQAVIDGAAAPKPLVDAVFGYLAQTRTAKYVQFPFAAGSVPPPPEEHTLKRFWRNHPWRYSTPAMRQVKLVVLSPDLLAKEEKVSEKAIKAAYDADKSKYSTPATRSVEIVTAEDEKSAKALLQKWQGGADWAAMKKEAANSTATAISFKDATPTSLPSERLAKAVFAAKTGEITGPVKGAIGTYVFKVTKVTGGGETPLAKVAPQIRHKLALQKAKSDVDNKVTELQDAIAGATAFDKLPKSLGTVAATATFDANGDTEDGKPADLPGSKKLAKAIVKTSFATKQGASPHVETGPGDSYYAVEVERVIKPKLKPFAKVKQAVLADWTGAQVEREAEVSAANLLAEVNSGHTFDAAAQKAGLTVTTSKPMTRNKPASGVPDKLVPILFSLKPGQPSMVQTQHGFVVATLGKVETPKPSTNPQLVGRIQSALDSEIQTSTLQNFAMALRQRYNVSINAQMLHQISQ